MRKMLERGASWWIADALSLAVLGLWFCGTANLPSYVLPGPIAVAERIASFFLDWNFFGEMIASTWRVFASVFLALVIGTGIALIHRYVLVLDWVIRGAIAPFLNSFPSIGWAILAAIWFSPDNFSIIFVQVAILTPFCLINMSEGLRQIDDDALEMARSFSRNRRRVLFRVTLPLLLPYLIAALRISYGVAWKISLVAELLGSSSGLGYLMLRAQGAADMTTVIATCVVITILFTVGEKLMIDPLAQRFSSQRA
ncbi:ABC transporter permease [Tardiphaga sp. 215_C5_N2_1]|uniref:ABC transporter permease n=1 Tax=Tardiphaga sp. 215_C5_N2_1 TaxID=3240774 RepID=UPI003F8ABA3B